MSKLSLIFQVFTPASLPSSGLQWHGVLDGCAVNWIRRLIQIKINPAKWKAVIFNTDKFADLIHFIGSYASTRRWQGKKKAKNGAAVFFLSAVWLCLKACVETQLENILKGMSYAQGNPFICQVHISIRSGRIFFCCCILMPVRVSLYQIHIYLHQYYIFQLFYLALWNSEYVIDTYIHTLRVYLMLL